MDRKPRARSVAAPGWLLVVIASATVAPALAEGRWVETRRIGPLLCHAEFPLEDEREVFARLGELQQELCERLGVPPAREAIAVYLFADRGGYREFVGKRQPELITRKAGYVKNGGAGQVMAYRSASFEVDLRHECTHALLHAALPRVPLWLDEGLAEYFELPPERRFSSPHRQAVVWQSRLGMPVPLDRLEGLASMSDMGRSEYRWSWAWTSFLLDGPPEARAELARYLVQLQTGGALHMADALKQALPEPQRAIVEHFRNAGATQPASPASYETPAPGQPMSQILLNSNPRDGR